MQGARGVIISIIGGEDMKLFEVDGAANHIRNLVDEDANIIWGSAFNPDLDGKIRVSVVATGIEQDAQSTVPSPATAAVAVPSALSTNRAPQRPVLDLGGEVEVSEEPSITDEAPNPLTKPDPERAPITLTPPEPMAYEPEPEPESDLVPESEIESEAREEPTEASSMLLSDPVAEAQEADEEEEEEAEDAKPFDLTGMQAGDDMGELEGDDVDEIVDPLAGLRGADEEPFDLASKEASEDGDAATQTGLDDAVFSEIDAAEEDSSDEDDGDGSGAPLSSAPTTPAQSAPPTPSEPSTLFERMANLSRSSGAEEDEDEDDDGSPALSIPRFLGRQNNQ